MRDNSQLFRGRAVHVIDCEINSSSITCRVAMSDYAHYLATTQGAIPPANYCRSLFVSIVILTADNYMVFGKMSGQTSSPEKIQCAGGGVSDEHFNRGGEADALAAVMQELAEEMYIDAEDKTQVSSLEPIFFKRGGEQEHTGIIYLAETFLTKGQLLKCFAQKSAKERSGGRLPEFRELVMVRKTAVDAEQFIKENQCSLADYMPSLIRELV